MGNLWFLLVPDATWEYSGSLVTVTYRFDSLQSAFLGCDTDGSGTIEKGEFAAILSGNGARLPPDALDTLFKKFDKNGDGKVSHVEFSRIFVGLLYSDVQSKSNRVETIDSTNVEQIITRIQEKMNGRCVPKLESNNKKITTHNNGHNFTLFTNIVMCVAIANLKQR